MTMTPPDAPVLGYHEDPYYRHTGRAPMIGSTMSAIFAWVAAIALGLAYAYADLYIRVYDIVSIMICFAFAAAMGFAVFGILRWGKVRNMLIVAIVSVTAALLGWYASWVGWEYALVARETTPPPLWEMAQHPVGIYRFAKVINGEGTFTMRDKPVNGGELWAAWIIEAIALLGCTAGIPMRAMRDLAFCENCSTWTRRQKGVVRIEHGDEDVLRERAEAKDFDHLLRLGVADKSRPVHFRVDLFGCPYCDQTHLLTVNRTTITYRNGQPQENNVKIVDRLWLTSDEAEDVRSLPERIAAQIPHEGPPGPPASTGGVQSPPAEAGGPEV